jgi:hypothetical protein
MPGHRFQPTAIATSVAGAVVILAAFCLAAAAVAEVAQRDGVRVVVAGGMSPTELPRSDIPVAVSMSGHISATVPGALPKLETISIAINSHGKLRGSDLPACRLGRISPSTTAEALAACRSSLIGAGHFSADVKIPEQSPFPSAGKILAFNGRLRGRPAIFAHVYGTDPVPTSYVLSFAIHRGRGTYGTLLQAALPQVTGEWGYVTGVSLSLQPRFVTASCPAPPGFPGAVFPLMKTSFGFAGGLTLDSTLTRSCRVRG